jgi:hypothetical protein
MNRRNQLGSALVVLAIVLFVVPALFPVQPMLTHYTGTSTSAPPAELEQRGFDIVAYENLTERGQELYVEALEHDGEYRVPNGTGAPAFDYPTDAERREAYERRENESIEGPVRTGIVIIERPADDSSLPPSDERYFERDRGEGETDSNESQRREMILRYDEMRTSTEQPPLGAPPQLLRLGAVLLAVVSLGVGGYLLSSR